MRWRTERDRAAERGSIVIAMSAMMLLVLVTTALIAQSRVELRAVTNEGNAVVAGGFAERGVAEVLARLEAGERAPFSDSGTDDLGSYRYDAQAIDDSTVVVRSEGSVDGVVRAVRVTIGGVAVEDYTLAVDTWAAITDNSGTISGRVVSNGALSVTGTLLGDAVELYGPNARCSGCGPTTVFPDRLDLPAPTIPTSGVRPCPADGRLTGVLDGQNGVPYVCRTNEVTEPWVTFGGTISVINPPLIVYIRTGLDVRFRNASVNGSGATEDFQLIGEGNDDYWWFDAWNSKVNGLLYAPGRDSLLQSASISGQLTVGVLSINGPYDVWISPSPEASPADTTGWVVTSFERLPAP